MTPFKGYATADQITVLHILNGAMDVETILFPDG
jgi:hypothetical protein